MLHRTLFVISALAFALSSAVAAEPPSATAAIPPRVKELDPPEFRDFPTPLVMAVSARSELAQRHTIQGLMHLHGGWEFEASRHFATAIQDDPDCVLAHWGLVMATLSPSAETSSARRAATERLIALIEQGLGSGLERGYAYGLFKYIEGGPLAAANAFRKVAHDFPNDLQAAVFAALFGRSGYDELGAAKPDQARSEEQLLRLIETHPNNPIPIYALLTIRAEAPDLTESLPLARKLVEIAPNYPGYFHLLGHYEWRCGEHRQAATAFGYAAARYSQWMKENNTSPADCPEWVMAEVYRIVALNSQGDFETAYAAARQLAETAIESDRIGAAGSRALLWEARTLPARLLMQRNLPGNAQEALASLPKPEATNELREKSLSYWWIDGLRFYLEARRLLDTQKPEEARAALDALIRHGDRMSITAEAASAGGERSHWNRAFRSLEVLASDLRGQLALSGSEATRKTAYNWYRSAADRQHRATLLQPPVLLAPMECRLGEFHLIMNEPLKAISAYREALTHFPNDMTALTGLEQAAVAAKDEALASATRKQIATLKENP